MNSRASPGTTVADGSYKIWLECVDDSTPAAGTGNVTFANRLGVPFQKDGVGRSAVPCTDPAGKFTAITYTYSGRSPGIANPALTSGQLLALNTNIDPNDLTRGLKIDDDFEVEARYELDAPDAGEVYGITLFDNSREYALGITHDTTIA